jgi:hypothetical protein
MSYVWLLPTARTFVEQGKVKVRSHLQLATLPLAADYCLSFLERLDGTHSLEELAQDPEAELILAILSKLDLLVYLDQNLEAFINRDLFLTRQLSYFAQITRQQPDRIIETLRKKHVTIIGMGGIGQHVIAGLAGSGVRNFLIVDHDDIDPSNLNRQFAFSKADFGKSKVSAVKEFVESRFSVNIESRQLNMDYDSFQLPATDLVVLCGECEGLYDHPEIIGTAPIIGAGYFGCMGAIGPYLNPGINGFSWQDYLKGRPRITALNQLERKLRHSWNSSGAAINTVVGGLLGDVIVKILGGIEEVDHLLGKRMYVNLKTFAVNYETH